MPIYDITFPSGKSFAMESPTPPDTTAIMTEFMRLSQPEAPAPAPPEEKPGALAAFGRFWDKHNTPHLPIPKIDPNTGVDPLAEKNLPLGLSTPLGDALVNIFGTEPRGTLWNIGTGVENVARTAVESFTSDIGAGSLAFWPLRALATMANMGKTATALSAAERGLAGAFGVEAARSIPGQIEEIVGAPDDRPLAQKIEQAGNLAMSGLVTVGGLAHAAFGRRGLTPKELEELKAKTTPPATAEAPMPNQLPGRTPLALPPGPEALAFELLRNRTPAPEPPAPAVPVVDAQFADVPSSPLALLAKKAPRALEAPTSNTQAAAPAQPAKPPTPPAPEVRAAAPPDLPKLVTDGGGSYRGEKDYGKHGKLLFFDDPTTKSTHALSLNEVPVKGITEAVKTRLAESRKAFAAPAPAPEPAKAAAPAPKSSPTIEELQARIAALEATQSPTAPSPSTSVPPARAEGSMPVQTPSGQGAAKLFKNPSTPTPEELGILPTHPDAVELADRVAQRNRAQSVAQNSPFKAARDAANEEATGHQRWIDQIARRHTKSASEPTPPVPEPAPAPPPEPPAKTPAIFKRQAGLTPDQQALFEKLANQPQPPKNPGDPPGLSVYEAAVRRLASTGQYGRLGEAAARSAAHEALVRIVSRPEMDYDTARAYLFSELDKSGRPGELIRAIRNQAKQEKVRSQREQGGLPVEETVAAKPTQATSKDIGLERIIEAAGVNLKPRGLWVLTQKLLHPAETYESIAKRMPAELPGNRGNISALAATLRNEVSKSLGRLSDAVRKDPELASALRDRLDEMQHPEREVASRLDRPADLEETPLAGEELAKKEQAAAMGEKPGETPVPEEPSAPAREGSELWDKAEAAKPPTVRRVTAEEMKAEGWFTDDKTGDAARAREQMLKTLEEPYSRTSALVDPTWLYHVYRDLFRLASTHIRLGVKTAAEFAQKVLGLDKPTPAIERAFADAKAGKMAGKLDELPKDIHDSLRDTKLTPEIGTEQGVGWFGKGKPIPEPEGGAKPMDSTWEQAKEGMGKQWERITKAEAAHSRGFVQRIKDEWARGLGGLKEGIKREIAQTVDAFQNNSAQRIARWAYNEFLRVSKDKLDRFAVPLVMQAKDAVQLRADLKAIQEAGKAKEKIRTFTVQQIFERAIRDFDRLKPMADHARRGFYARLDRDQKAGLDVTRHEDYVPNYVKDYLFDGHKGWFMRNKKYARLADAIKEGALPETLDIAELMEHRTLQSERLVQRKQMLAELSRAFVDPVTGRAAFKAGDELNRIEHRARITEMQKDPSLTKEQLDAKVKEIVKQKTEELFADYDVIHLGRESIYAFKPYSRLFKALSGESSLSGSPGWDAAMATAGMLKHTMLAFDTFHMFRMGYYSLAARGSSSYKKGLSLAEHSPELLKTMAEAGEIPMDTYKWATEKMWDGGPTRHEAFLQLNRHGLNVMRVADRIYTHVLEEFPLIGTYNRFLFEKFTRGVMVETALDQLIRNKETFGGYRSTSATTMPAERQLYFKTAHEVNTRFGNLLSQGIIKNKNLQQILQLTFLAPQWVESMAWSELRGLRELGTAVNTKALTDDTQKLIRIGMNARIIGSGFGAMFLANQLINQYYRGEFTWENPDPHHKLDAWIPGPEGSYGFYISPMTVVAELTHDFLRYMAKFKDNPFDVVHQIQSNKLSPMSRMLDTAMSGRDFFGEPVDGAWDRAKLMFETGVNSMVPLGFQSFLPGLRKQEYPGSKVRQGFASAGIKVEPVTPRQTIENLVSAKARQEFPESDGDVDSLPLNVQLRLRNKVLEERPELKEKPRPTIVRSEAAIREQGFNRAAVEERLGLTDILKEQKLSVPGFNPMIKAGKNPVWLTEKQRERYVELIAEGTGSRLQRLLENPEFKKRPQASKQKTINKMMEGIRDRARTKLFRELNAPR